MNRHRRIAATTLVGIILAVTFGVISSNAQERTLYRSEADDLVTVRQLAILPVFDNLRGIYSRPVENHLMQLLKNNHRFEMSSATTAGPILTPEEIEESSTTAQEISKNLDADAFIASKIIKGPSGITIRMSLFLTKDQKLFAREELQGIQRMDVETIQKHAEELFQKLLKNLPYAGVVLSRQGTKVTVNLGKRDGVVDDQVVSVVQILKLNRHPKFNFIVSSEKELIGKIKLLKVDETLSFGRILTEKEAGSIQVNAKIDGLDAVVYTNVDSLSDTKSAEDALLERPDGRASFGDKPTEWLPRRNPAFGMLGAKLGLSTFTENIRTGTGNLDSKSPFYPFVVVEGEAWLTQAWSLYAQIKQGIISTDDPGGGEDLSRSLSNYEFLMGYNIRLGSGVWTPRVELLGGYSTYRLYSDKSTAVTTKTYNGMKLGVGGMYPLSPDSNYALGAKLFFFFSPNVKEEPSSSGSSKNAINQFSLFLDKRLRINLKARASLDFELYASDFSGGTVTSSSQKHTALSAGLYYLF